MLQLLLHTTVFERYAVTVDIPIDEFRAQSEHTILEELVDEFQPALVVCGVGIFTAAPDHHPSSVDEALFRKARASSISTFGVLDAWMNYRERFLDQLTGDEWYYLPDRLAVMDEKTAAMLIADGAPENRIFVSGHPFLDMVRRKHRQDGLRERLRESLGVQDNQSMVTFFSEPLQTYYGSNPERDPGYNEFDVFKLVKAAMENLSPGYRLFVREHPLRSTLAQDKISEGVEFLNQHELDAIDLIIASDALLGMTTSLLVYAVLLNRSVAVIQPGLHPSRDRNVLTRRNILPNIESVEELVVAISAGHALSENACDKIRSELKWDQEPTARVVSELQSLADSLRTADSS